MIAMALGQADRAIELLEQEVRDRGPFLYWLRRHSWFDPFRSDPRFDALCRRLRLPDA